MKRSKFGGFVILGTAVAAVANSSVSVNALGVKDFLKFFSRFNFKSLFNCICGFIAERAGKRVNVSDNICKYAPSAETRISIFYSDFIDPTNANASLEEAKKVFSRNDFRKLIRKIARDCKDSQIIHIWDKNGDLGLPAFDGDNKEEFVLGGITLVPVERKALQNCHDGGSYHGWVVESQIDPGKILFIHPNGDLKDLGSGEERFYVSEYFGLNKKFEDMTEEEKRQKQLWENKKIAEAEQSTPALDRELLKKHAPELYKFLENKGTKREVASILESSEGNY